MRGKTNIPPRLKPVINGDVENFVVASGNTIAKGDFVSYVLNNQYTSFDSRNMTLQYKYEYDEVNHKFLLAFTVTNASPVIMLVQVTNGELVVLDSVEAENVVYFGGACIDGSYIYVCQAPSSISSGAANVVVKKYEIVNDEIVYLQDYTNTITISGSSVSGVVRGIAVKGSKVYFGVKYKSSSYASVRLFYGEFGEEIPYNKYVDLASVGNNYADISHLVSYVDGNYIVIIGTLHYTNYLSSFVVAIDTTLQTVTTNDLIKVNLNERLTGCDKYGSKIFCATNSGISIIEFANGAFTILYNEQYTNYKGSIIGRVSQDEFVVYFTNASKTRTFTIGETIQTVDNSLNSIVMEVDSSLHYILSDFTTNVLLECSSANGVVKYFGNVDETNGFVIGEPTNYVQSYNGSFTVGFAKTGGTAGDTIQVYVPHNS